MSQVIRHSSSIAKPTPLSIRYTPAYKLHITIRHPDIGYAVQFADWFEDSERSSLTYTALPKAHVSMSSLLSELYPI